MAYPLPDTNRNIDPNNNHGDNGSDGNTSKSTGIAGILIIPIALIAVVIFFIVAYRKKTLATASNNDHLEEVMDPMECVPKRVNRGEDFGCTGSTCDIDWDENTPHLSMASISRETRTASNDVTEPARNEIISSNEILSRCSSSETDVEEALYPSRSYSPEGAPIHIKLSRQSSFTSSNSSSADNRMHLHSHPSSPSSPHRLSEASSHSAATASRETIQSLEKEIRSLTLAAQAFQSGKSARLKLDKYLERATEELDAVRQDIRMSSTFDDQEENEFSSRPCLPNYQQGSPRHIEPKNQASFPAGIVSAEKELTPAPHKSTVSKEEPLRNQGHRGSMISLAESSSLSDVASYDSSCANSNSDSTPGLQSLSTSRIDVQALSTVSHLTSSIESDLATLSTATQSFPKNSEPWLLLHSYLEAVRDKLDAVRRDNDTRQHIVEIIAPRGNLGLVVDKHPSGVSVYIRGLHPLSPLRDQLQLGDVIVAIDDDDVQQLSPGDVGMILSRKSMNTERKISIIREHDVSHNVPESDLPSLHTNNASLHQRHSNHIEIIQLGEGEASIHI